MKVVLTLFLTCIAWNLASSQEKDRVTEKYCSVVKAGYRMSLTLYDNLVKRGAENLIFSPYSISSISAMVMLGTRGETQRELRGFLQYGICDPDIKKIHQSHKRVREFIEKQTSEVTLVVADRIFPDTSFPLHKSYTDMAEMYYGSQVENLNFQSQPEASRIRINEWIEKTTNGVLSDMMPPGSINSQTDVVLANAIYFKGTWKTQFDPRNNIVGDFHINEQTKVPTTFMTKTGTMKYASNGAFSLVELPYKGDVTSMIILLPKERNGLKHLEQSLGGGVLHALGQYGTPRRVSIKLPKFKLDYQEELVETFQDLGVKTLFSRPNFSAMTNRTGMVISTIRHKAFIEVNEEGTEAAAATVVAGTRSLNFSEDFTCNHPFMFYIIHKPSKVILFLGRLVSPV